MYRRFLNNTSPASKRLYWLRMIWIPLKKFCNRAVLIHEGKIIKEGSPVQVADEYSRLNQAVIDKAVDQEHQYTGKSIKNRHI